MVLWRTEAADVLGSFPWVSCQSGRTALDASYPLTSATADAAWDSLSPLPGLAQEGDKGVAAKSLPPDGVPPWPRRFSAARKQFCLMPPSPEPSRTLNPQPHWIHWAKARGVMRVSLLPFYR